MLSSELHLHQAYTYMQAKHSTHTHKKISLKNTRGWGRGNVPSENSPQASRLGGIMVQAQRFRSLLCQVTHRVLLRLPASQREPRPWSPILCPPRPLSLGLVLINSRFSTPPLLSSTQFLENICLRMVTLSLSSVILALQGAQVISGPKSLAY